MTSHFRPFGSIAACAVLLLLAACQSPSTKVCASGRVCASGTICDDLLDMCVLPGQRDACAGLNDTDACSVTDFNGAPGICRDGLCILAGCGDGFVLGAETCDGENLGESSDCVDLGYIESAPLGCNADCTYDQSQCTGFCGDGLVSGPEFCDGVALDGKDCTDLGFYNPEGLTCNPAACVFDTAACTGFCGDGEVSGGESCDGAVLDGKDCTDVGFYNPGGLACNDACGFDTSACTGFCGDGLVSAGETCDGLALAGQDCTSFGFYNVDGLVCNPVACVFDTSACTGFCGDGVASAADGESCDGADLASQDCTDAGFYSPGGLACNNLCGLDTSGCTGFCGDGVANTANGESCDGADLASQDCTDAGFYNAGGLTCNTLCGFDTSACTGFCGDGTASNGESCDGADLLGQDCTDAGFYNASGLACNNLCGLETGACTGFCGDNTASNGESCDGTDLAGLDCTDRGFYNPNGLACNGFCGFDTGACTGFCGDGAVTNGESCDGTDLAGQDCTDLGYYFTTGLSCNPTACVLDATSCSGECGDGVTDFLFFEFCDEGGNNSNDPDALCRLNCLGQRCGDGILDVLAGENCDDGNPLPGDGCSGQCLAEVCGNGVVDLEVVGNGFLPSEDCDDGENGLNHDGCAGACLGEDRRWRRELQGDVPQARNRHAMVYDVARERVLLFGGALGQGQGQFADTWEWDGTSWTERIVTTAPSPRFGTAMAYDAARGKVVLFGGGFRQNSTNETWEWNGSTWTEMTPANSPPARYRHAMAYDSARGRVVLYGGSGGNNSGPLSDTWEWDGNDWTDVTPGSSPPLRRNHAMTYDPVNGEVVLFGGAPGRGAPPLADTWAWDGSTWTDRTPATSPAGREGLALAYNAARGRVVLFSGGIGRGGGAFADTWEWDGTSWTETTTVALPTTRYRHAMAYDTARDKLVAFGGSSGGCCGSGPMNETWEGSGGPGGTDWIPVTPLATPSVRENPTVAYDRARGRVVLFGGISGSFGTLLRDTWEWDGSRWTEIATAGGPSARERSAMAYDPSRGKLILFGGGQSGRSGGSLTLADTWEWDGSDWTQLSPANSPSARYHHTMAYDAARGRIVLFGGSNGGGGSGPLADTWTWDGSTWTEVTPATSPPPRTSHAMAYDARRQRVVLFAGSRQRLPLSDTWEWDGSSWTEQFPIESPPQRYRFGMAYDAVISQIVVFGGTGGSGTGTRNDTWTWDGSNWTEINPPDAPLARRKFRMVYDALRAEVLLFGGGGSQRTGVVTFGDTHTLQFSGGVRESCTNGLDGDGDGLVGCADPDCWSRCTPECPPNSTPAWPADCSTAAGVPRCGDGVCNLNLENSRMCPGDCAATPVCGDFFCEGAESVANCPGDCSTP